MKNVKLAALSALLLGTLAFASAHADAKTRHIPGEPQPTVRTQPRDSSKPQARRVHQRARHAKQRRMPRPVRAN